jgi:hypothetical protein
MAGSVSCASSASVVRPSAILYACAIEQTENVVITWEKRTSNMALFVVRHQHEADRCPAGDPAMGMMLLEHLSPANAAANGIQIQADAAVDGRHTLYLIVNAADQETVNRFMATFGNFGTVEVLPASACESVIARGAC